MTKNFSIKTYIKRNGSISKRQKKLYKTFFSEYCVNLENKTLNFNEIFQNENQTIIEIGFGTGSATYKIALANPEKNYLAIDVYHTGVAKLISKLHDHKIKNIRIIEDDAVKVLSEAIQPNSVAGFHIFFPDPWPKKKHHKRRLMQADKIKLMSEKLIKGGFIYFVTDWENYAESALTELRSTPAIKNKYKNFAPKQSWRPETNFEKKALKAGRKIFELIFVKI